MRKKLSEMIPSEYYPLFKNRQPSDPRYWIYKGGRASCKSSSVSIYIPTHIIKNPLSNVVVIRANENTLRDSVYEQIKWGIAQLGATEDFRFLKSPLEIVYKPTGQRIIFKGANNPQSITSIAISHGVIDTVWFEEFFQIQDAKTFDMIDLSFRGQMPKGYKIRIIGTFSYAIGALLAGVMIKSSGFDSIFMIAALFMIIALIITLLLKPNTLDDERKKGDFVLLLKNKSFLLFAIYFILCK